MREEGDPEVGLWDGWVPGWGCATPPAPSHFSPGIKAYLLWGSRPVGSHSHSPIRWTSIHQTQVA